MSTHLLQELDLVGREKVLQELPSFDLHRLGLVTELLLRIAPQTPDTRDLLITSLYNAGDGEYVVTLRFAAVHRVRLPELAPTFYFAELEIEDIRDHQMEGIRYRARDHCMSEFEVLCGGVEIVACTRPSSPELVFGASPARIKGCRGQRDG